MPHCRKHNRYWADDEERDEQFACSDCERERDDTGGDDMVAIKSYLDKAVDAIADIPEREILSVSVSLDGPRVHLEWPFFQRWFGGRQVYWAGGHVSIVHEGVTYTAIMEQSVPRGSIACPMAGVEVEA